jgi:hypothetical protein
MGRSASKGGERLQNERGETENEKRKMKNAK